MRVRVGPRCDGHHISPTANIAEAAPPRVPLTFPDLFSPPDPLESIRQVSWSVTLRAGRTLLAWSDRVVSGLRTVYTYSHEHLDPLQQSS